MNDTKTIGRFGSKITPRTPRTITEAINDCNRYIAREEGRAADLRPADVAKRLEDYKQHRAWLLAQLEKMP